VLPALSWQTLPIELLAKVRNLPFDRLRVNGLRLKLFSFSVRGELVEPQKNTFARASIDRRKIKGNKGNPSVTGGYTRNIGGNIPGKDSVVAWGPGRYAPEASAGIPLLILNSLNFRRRRQEASAPAPSTEKSVPHGSQRTGLASRPWAPWAFTANLFSSDLGHPPVTEGLRFKMGFLPAEGWRLR